MILRKKKSLALLVGVVAIATGVAFNLNYLSTNYAGLNVTLANVEALARNEGDLEGGFPACQNQEGWKEYGYIPFCVDGVCKKNQWKAKGSLDVNYCP